MKPTKENLRACFREEYLNRPSMEIPYFQVSYEYQDNEADCTEDRSITINELEDFLDLVEKGCIKNLFIHPPEIKVFEEWERRFFRFS